MFRPSSPSAEWPGRLTPRVCERCSTVSFNLRFSSPATWLALLCLALATSVLAVPVPSLLDILKDELAREFTALKAKADPAPYYMAYEVTDEQAESASASLGALADASSRHIRGLDTTIRIGSPGFDNYHPYKGSRVRFTSFTPLSLDDNPNQIRRAIWSESDRVYRLASRRFLQLKTDEQLLAEQKDHDADFSTEPAETYSQLPETYEYDAEAWPRKVRAWSAEFKKHPQILASGVSFRGEREIRTFVNTEGT